MKQVAFEDVGKRVLINKWRWAGHVARMKDYTDGVVES
jgi:hypothetical protein